MAQPIRLGDLLLRAGVITDVDLNRALEEQQRWGGRLGTTLVRMGVLTEDLLVKALARQLGMQRANLDAISVPGALLGRLDRAFCENHSIVPLAYDQERRTVLVAVADPSNVVALDELGSRLGLKVETYLAGEGAIRDALLRLFGGVDLDPSLSGRQADLRMINNQGESVENQAPVTNVPPPPSSAGMARPPTSAGMARPPTSASLPPTSAGQGDARVRELTELAHKQTRAIQAVVELLIERGVISREEYLAWLQRR